MFNRSVKDIGIDSFLEGTQTAGTLRPLLGAIFYPFFGLDDPDSYLEQLPSASRNVEMTLEKIIKILKRPLKAAMVLDKIVEMASTYSRTQKKLKNEKHYLVYTDLDRRIPFRPEDDNLYVYLISSQMAMFGEELVNSCSYPEIKRVLNVFMEANYQGAEVFTRFPTTMPRFEEHDQVTLKAVQAVDNPFNCCPSQHIAYCLLIYNIAGNLPGFRGTETLESLKQASSLIFRPVLYTKQHALVDVAFGMHSAGKAFEKHFEINFDSLIYNFPLFQARDKDVPYNLIAEIYSEIDGMWKEGMVLADAVGAYFQRYQFPLVKPGGNNAYFDLGSRKVVELF